MTDRRRIILADARRRYADGQRLGLGWSWGQCLTTAAAADRIRRNFADALDGGLCVKPATENETTAATGKEAREACELRIPPGTRERAPRREVEAI